MADLAVKIAAAAPEQVTLLRISCPAASGGLCPQGRRPAPASLAAGALQRHHRPGGRAVSPIMTKVGVYAILRTFTLIYPLQHRGI